MENQITTNKINYILIFLMLIGVNAINIMVTNVFFSKPTNDNAIIVENISKINDKINDLVEIVKLNNSNIKLTDRLDPAVIQDFADDSEFLAKIVKLKKQIIKRELEGEIVKLENEKLARNKTLVDGKYADGYNKNTAADIFDLLMINASSKKAVIKIENNIAKVSLGDNIRGYIIKDINANQVIMINQDGDIETLNLTYLTTKNTNKINSKGNKNAK